MRGARRSLARPASDDGAPDPALRARLADPSVSEADLAVELRGARMLTAVVAVLDEQDEHRGDKSSHMAVVSMVNARGERGLLAFSGVDSLKLWNADARPVPAKGRDIAAAALAENSSAVVIDVVGPRRRVFAGADLLTLAEAT